VATGIEQILIAEPKDFAQEAIDLLAGIGNVICMDLDQVDVKQALRDYDVIWIRLGLTIRQDDIPTNPRCRYLITATTGLKKIRGKLGTLPYFPLIPSGWLCVTAVNSNAFSRTVFKSLNAYPTGLIRIAAPLPQLLYGSECSLCAHL